MALLAVLGGFRGSPFLLLAAILLTALGAVVHIWGRFALRGIECRRTVTPTHVEVGDTVQVAIEIVNDKAMPLPWLRVDAPLPTALRLESGGESDRPISYLVGLSPNDRVVERFEVRVQARGIHELGPVWLRTADPLGFKIVRSRTRLGGCVVALPAVVPLERLGLDPSFQLQERHHEDDFKSVGNRDESTSLNGSIVLITDLHQVSNLDAEWILSAARSIASAALGAGHEVGLETGAFLPGTRRRIVARSGRGADQAARIAEALATVSFQPGLSTDRVIRRAARRHDIETIILVISTRPSVARDLKERSSYVPSAASEVLGQSLLSRRRLEFSFLPPPPPDFLPRIDVSETKVSETMVPSSGADTAAPSRADQPVKDDFDSWNRTVFLPLARLLLRLSWVWPWTLLLSQIALPGIEPGVSLGSLILLSWTGHALGRLRLHGRRRISRWAPFFVVAVGTLAVLGTSWLLSYRSMLPIWELAWLSDLGLEMLQGGPTTVRRALAIVAAAFVCVGAVVDAEEPSDHASIWSAFVSAILLVIAQASIVEFASDPRVHAPTSWLLFAFSVGLLALIASGARLGHRLEPKARRPWQPS